MADTSSDADVLDSRDIIARIEELEGDEDLDADARVELAELRALAKQGEDMIADWRHGECLVRDSYFQRYAQELAEDCGMIQDGARWPYTCIDWEQAARELQQDYTSLEYDGVTYWAR